MNHEFLEETDNTEVSGNQLVTKYKCEFCISCSYKWFLFNFTYISVWKKLFAILKEISPGCYLVGSMSKLKLQYFGHFMQSVDSLEKTLMLGGIEGRRKRGRQRMRWLDGITDLME